MDTVVIFTPAPGPSGSAMAADTSAVYWYAPDSVVESGGVITSWDDKTSSGFDLAQVGSIPLPSYNASGYVEFDGTEVIGDSTITHASLLKAVLNGGGEAAIFYVFQGDSSAQAQDTIVNTVIAQEGPASAYGNNQSLQQAYRVNKFGTDNALTITNGREFADAYALYTPSTDQAPLLDTLTLVQVVVDQTTVAGDVNDGTYTNSATPTVANFPSGDNGLFLGGACNGTAVADAYIGRLYEVFATTDTSAGNVDAIRAELATIYGI